MVVSAPEAAVRAESSAEQQIVVLARQQAQREEEVLSCRRQIEALQGEVAEAEQENRLRAQQEAVLKEELRSADRSCAREGADMTYLKNVVVKLLQTGDRKNLLPVLAMLLHFSPQEARDCMESTAGAQNGEPPVSFFSALSFGGNPRG